MYIFYNFKSFKSIYRKCQSIYMTNCLFSYMYIYNCNSLKKLLKQPETLTCYICCLVILTCYLTFILCQKKWRQICKNIQRNTYAECVIISEITCKRFTLTELIEKGFKTNTAQENKNLRNFKLCYCMV